MRKKCDTKTKDFEFDILKAAEETIELMLKRAQESQADQKMVTLKTPANTNSSITAPTNDPVSRMVTSIGLGPLNEAESTTIFALLAWVADIQNVDPKTVQSIVEANFSVDHVVKIQRINYQYAVNFLVKFQMDELN